MNEKSHNNKSFVFHMKVSTDQIKKLRTATGAGIMDCRRALEESQGDLKKAERYLKAKGLEKAAKKATREIKSGRVYAYIHGEGKIGAMLELGCETDFVARNSEFTDLARELAMQIASMNPKDVKALLNQDYIRDPGVKISDLITSAIAKLGENIEVRRFTRMGVGE
jgi:elongation factor Ts